MRPPRRRGRGSCGGVAGVADGGMVEANKEEGASVERVAENVVRDLLGLAEALYGEAVFQSPK